MLSLVDMDMEIPAVEIEVEANFSRKVPVRCRFCSFAGVTKAPSLTRLYP